jgi:cytoskeletal protein RodZ
MTNIPTAPQPSAPPPSVPSPGAVPPGGSAYGGQPQYPMSPEPAKRGFGVWIAVAAVIALLIGLGVGFVAAQPSKNDVTKQKNAAQLQVTQLQQDLATAQSSLTTAQNSSTANATARTTCSKAATDARDLIAQHENLWQDFSDYLAAPYGSAAEAQIQSHMSDQQQTMTAQRDVVNAEISACTAALGA